MHRDLRHFTDILRESCAYIDRDYFELPQAEADRVYRERVYCYELYHQMRCRWGRFPYSLGGEIDKGGHPIFRDGSYARAPTTMESAFEDTKPYVLTDLGKQFVHYTMSEAVTRIDDRNVRPS